ncbi:hypothetical protein NC651_011872 [Populus alba x Populus x berolinensis]|nr:hypothetical protein NC651_011872 [Populus alba x Populus x berolinensis]
MKMVHILWKINGDLGLVDLGNNLFLTSNLKDRDYIIFRFMDDGRLVSHSEAIYIQILIITKQQLKRSLYG